MDPNAALEEIRALALGWLNEEGADPDELAQRVLDLDEWLTKGGFLPQAWKTVRRA